MHHAEVHALTQPSLPHLNTRALLRKEKSPATTKEEPPIRRLPITTAAKRYIQLWRKLSSSTTSGNSSNRLLVVRW